MLEDMHQENLIEVSQYYMYLDSAIHNSSSA